MTTTEDALARLCERQRELITNLTIVRSMLILAAQPVISRLDTFAQCKNEIHQEDLRDFLTGEMLDHFRQTLKIVSEPTKRA